MKLDIRSIQTRLTLLVLGVVLLFGLGSGYATYTTALEETDELLDAQLVQFAQSLMALVEIAGSDEEHTAPVPPQTHKYQQGLAFQVWDVRTNDPHLLLMSGNMWDMRFHQLPPEGFSNGVWHDGRLRYYRLHSEQRGMDVLVGHNNEARKEMAEEIAGHNVAPFLLGLLPLAIFAMLGIRFGLRPLHKLAASLRRLTPEQLQPVKLRDTPKEIAPVVDALNGLLNRISQTLENERRFTADASHELRTPLAALQAQVQAAQLAQDKAERDEALAKALQGAARMAHLVGQLLTLSRLDEDSSLPPDSSVKLRSLIEECCAELGTAALAKNIEIDFSAEASPELPGSPDMIRVLLRNLVDNAIRYTPHGGRVAVSLYFDEKKNAVLEIADSGIGVAEEKLAQLGQRFNRIAPNAADGVGLGLSIVQRIVERHHANMAFKRAELGGLSVTVSFPFPRPNT